MFRVCKSRIFDKLRTFFSASNRYRIEKLMFVAL